MPTVDSRLPRAGFEGLTSAAEIEYHKLDTHRIRPMHLVALFQGTMCSVGCLAISVQHVPKRHLAVKRDGLRHLLDDSTTLVLDMCGTFMFGHDRFGPSEKYGQTYRLLKGTALSDESINGAIAACVEALRKMYRDPAHQESFPSVFSTLLSLTETRLLPESELGLLEKIFAEHEAGYIPDDYCETLCRLSERYRLALVSDIWSRKDKYVAELKRARVFDLFEVTVFSSDSCAVKPCRRPFDEAVGALGVNSSEVLVVGDSLRCDIGGATAAGLRSIWINPNDEAPPSPGPQPNGWIRDLRELESLVAR